MKRGDISIPETRLDALASEAAGLKRDAWRSLARLEAARTGETGRKPGGWRHDPAGWLRENGRS